MNITRVYNRLPSDAGITFEGFGDIIIETRKKVKKQLEEFINYCYTTNKSALRVLIGEWGEGKTDAYYRYIQPKTEEEKHYSFFVSASTLANGYEISAINELTKDTPLSSLRFLTTIFNSIKAENLYDERIPNPEDHKTADEYMETTLDNLLTNTDSRIFIFIDEFEELLLNIDKLNLIISGIKETINGRYPLISEKGKYPGRIHFIISATPDAFYRLQVSNDTALIFGGLGRRTGVIDLPSIRKKEGFEFLWELLQYSYNNNIPAVNPIGNYGIFQSLYRITLGNPGNLVSKFTRLMNKAKLNDKEVKIIDGKLFTEFLENETIFVYGGSTPCIETDINNQILSIIKDQNDPHVGEACVKIFSLMTSGIKPYSIKELENYVNRSDIKEIISLINDDIRTRLGIEKSILKVSKLREGKTYNDVMDLFKTYIKKENDEYVIKINNYSELIDSFEDRLLSLEVIDNNIVKSYYLPIDKRSVESFFEGIGDDKSKEIEIMITRRLTNDVDYYIISDPILQQIYPYPIPKELEFVKNRELRMKLWRDVTRNLSDNYERYIIPALFKILNQSNFIEIKDTQVYWNNYEIRDMRYDNSHINCLFYTVNGDVKKTDIDEIDGLFRSRSPPILCIILIHTGSITPDASDVIEYKQLGEKDLNIIFNMYLHPTLTKKIISIYRAIRESNEDDINYDIYNSIIKKILIQDLNISENFDIWLKSQGDRGKIVNDIVTESTINLKDLFDAMKYYINYREIKNSISEIYNKNKLELSKYIIYDSRIGLVPDIDEPKFQRISMDLLSNQFLKKEADNYILNLHPIEQNIIIVLKKHIKLSEEEIESHFIINKSQLLQKLYLPILEYKGIILKDGKNYTLNDRSIISKKLDLTYRRTQPIFSKNEYIENGFLYMIKQRDEKFVTISEYYEYLTKLYRMCENIPSNEEEIYLQKCMLFLSLTDHFEKEYLPLFKNANNKVEEIIIDSTAIHKNFKGNIDKLSENFYKWLKINFDPNIVEEYVRINKQYKNIDQKNKIDEKYIREYISNFTEDEKSIFSFRKEAEDAYNFNPKQYHISLIYEDILKIIQINERKIDNLFETFDQFNSTLNKINNKLTSLNIDKQSKISNKFLNLIINLTKDIIPDIELVEFDSINIETLLEYLSKSKSDINSNLLNLESSLNTLSKTDSYEKELNMVYFTYLEAYQNIKTKYDIDIYKDICKIFYDDVDIKYKEYTKYSEEIKIDNVSDIINLINSINTEILKIKTELINILKPLQESWMDYKNNIIRFIQNTNTMIEFLSKKYEVDFEDVKKIISILESRVNYNNIIKIEFKISEIDELKSLLKNKFYEIIKNIMSEEIYAVLESTIIILHNEKREWLIIEELIKRIQVQTGFQETIIKSNLQQLIIQGFFKEGISLSI